MSIDCSSISEILEPVCLPEVRPWKSRPGQLNEKVETLNTPAQYVVPVENCPAIKCN